MSKFFKNNTAMQPMSELQMQINRYNSSRANLLLVAIFTLINLVLLISKSYTYFLFSASIPYILTTNAMYLCGMHPDEFYEDIDLSTAEFLDRSVFVVVLIISLVIIALYALSYFLSKKQKVGWMIAALAFFVIDTVVMFWYYGLANTEMLLDVAFHVWVIVSLSMGIHAYFKIKSLPPEEEAVPMPADGNTLLMEDGFAENQPLSADFEESKPTDSDQEQ